MFDSRLRARAVVGMCCLAALWATAGVNAGGFRGVEWGAGKAEVLATEKHQLHHDIENEIGFWNFKFAGVEAGLVYTFEDGKFVRAQYLSRHRTNDPSEDLADYESFKAQLDEHFGAHLAEEWIWIDGREHGEDEPTLAEITSGTAELVTRWELEDANLRLLIAGSDGVVQTVRAIFEPKRAGGGS